MLQVGMDCPRITQITLIIYPQMAQMFHKWFDPRLPGGRLGLHGLLIHKWFIHACLAACLRRAGRQTGITRITRIINPQMVYPGITRITQIIRIILIIYPQMAQMKHK